MKSLLLIAIGSALVNNVVLSQFLGLCPFLGVSKKVETAAGMGAAVLFVITIASAVTNLIYTFLLVPTDLTYLNSRSRTKPKHSPVLQLITSFCRSSRNFMSGILFLPIIIVFFFSMNRSRKKQEILISRISCFFIIIMI
jgi:Na+-translocating ferredoxin:NAD+ oxidoreductase RnfA subunit